MATSLSRCVAQCLRRSSPYAAVRYGTSSQNAILFLSQDLDISYTAFRQWLDRKLHQEEVKTQMFNQERYDKLGANLSAATFMVARGGSVKVVGVEQWYRKNEKGRYFLPRIKVPDFDLEGIDSTGVHLFYEGLDNLHGLEHLRYFKLSQNPHADDFFLSKFTTICTAVEFLEISECSGITERGLACLHQLENLKCLKLSKVPGVKNIELVTILLEEMMPQCTILLGKHANRINAVLQETDKSNTQSGEISERIKNISEPKEMLQEQR